jgi:hypothetical protein
MEQLHMSYDTIMNLQFYIFENLLNHYSAILEERKKAEKEEMKSQGYDEKNYSPDSMMRQAQKNMPKMPTIQMPKIK